MENKELELAFPFHSLDMKWKNEEEMNSDATLKFDWTSYILEENQFINILNISLIKEQKQ